MTKIYTKTGDKGETGLWGGRRLSKSHPRVRVYGDVDELNSSIGVSIAALPSAKSFKMLNESLQRIQAELFTLGSILATPPEESGRLSKEFRRGIPADAISRLEREIDAMTDDLEPMRHFILPGGSMPGALLHLSRTVCRRAERELVALREHDEAPENLIVYLNRLSDFLFTAARWANAKLRRGEIPWKGLN